MSSIIRKLKGFFVYLTKGFKTLDNWSAFYLDLLRSFLGLNNKNNIYKLRDGTIIKVHPNSFALNHVFYTVFLKGEYDGLEKFYIKEDDKIIDIGAHLGFFSIKAAKKAKNGTIYSLEPFSMHYRLLEENIKSNNIKNVNLYNIALSDKTAELSFFYTMHGDPGDTSIFKINPKEKNYEEKVNSMSLNEFFEKEKLDRCDFLKLDCEGAEYSILMNANSDTLSKIKKIAMEWHRFEDDQNPISLANFLRQSGFKLIEPNHYDGLTGFLYAYK